MNKKFNQRSTMILDPKGDYEEACQFLLTIGEEWIRDKPLNVWNRKKHVKKEHLEGKNGLRNVFLRGLEEMDINSMPEEQGTAVMANLHYIHHYGRKKWLECAKLHRKPSDFYNWPKKGSVFHKR